MVGRRASALSPLFFALSIGAALAQAPQCEPDKVAQKYPAYAGKVVKVAASPVQPPYAFTDPSDPQRMAGLEVELIEKTMSCAGLKFEYIKGAWSGLLPALFSGTTDVMIGAVNYRPDRAERADFILYMRAGHSIVVHKDNPKKIAGMETLCGHIGSAMVSGSSVLTIERQTKKCTDEGKPAIDYRPSAENEAGYRQVINERVDFVMDDAVTAAARARRVPELKVAFTATTDILSGMVVTKGNKTMLQIVADGLAVQQQDGSLAELAKKYGLPSELMIPIQTRS